jgi:hypothetical protein
MIPHGPRVRSLLVLWLCLVASLLFTLAAVYAAFMAETSGDLAMASLAIPLFGWSTLTMAGALRAKYREPFP